MSAKTRVSCCSAVLIVIAMGAPGPVAAEVAPVPRAVVSAEVAPDAMSGFYESLTVGEEVVEIAGAQWLQLRFGSFDLGGGTLTVTGGDGQSQSFSQEQLQAWEGLTAIFNTNRLTVSLSDGATAEIADIVIGLPAAQGAVDTLESVTPAPLIDLLGGDLQRYIPIEDVPPSPDASLEGASGNGATIESICGTVDDRAASTHPFSGRIMPIGCTGWIIEGGAILTAGHCIGSSTQTLEFNVPASQANGSTVSPPLADQYRVIASSIVSDFTGVGNDWAIFEVLPNSQTGLTAIAAQGGGFALSNTANPPNVVITGYGVDGPSPDFGNPPPRNADNQTQQTHVGNLTENSVQGPSQATIRYTVDTQGGNSGSPVIVAGGGNVAIGIHTNGGCGAGGGANAGTSFRNAALWNTIGSDAPGSSSIAGWVKLLLPGN